MLHTMFSTWTLKPIFLYMEKKVAVYFCLLMDLVHCPNSGMFITEEFAMFKRKENSNNNNKKLTVIRKFYKAQNNLKISYLAEKVQD